MANITHKITKFEAKLGGLWLGLPQVPGYPSGTRVINYPGNFLLPGYPHRLFNLIYF